MKTLSIILLAIILLNSCMTTKTQVGKYKEATGDEYTYDKVKQTWLFWGLLPLGRNNADTPESGDCQIITRFNFVDFIITTLTVGIVVTYTIKVEAKK
jgi:hypothetical protein